MGDNCVVMRQRKSNEPIVGDLPECGNGSWRVSMAVCPGTYRAKRGQNLIIRRKEKRTPSVFGPQGEIIFARCQFISDLFDTRHTSGGILQDQPLPECWAEIKPVVQVPRLNKNVGI